MAGEKSNNEQRRGSRRRYFRNRSAKGKADSENAAPKEAAGKSNRNERGTSDSRTGRSGRRRRRSRNQNSNPNQAQQTNVSTPADSIVNLDGYTPPDKVYVYTHVLRANNRDNYEFRAEHFSKLGRRLEDYEIDLSILYADDNRAEAAEDIPADE